MKKQTRHTPTRSHPNRKKRNLWIVCGIILALLIALQIKELTFAYSWSGTYPDHWKLGWLEELHDDLHTLFSYLPPNKYWKTVGSPDGTAEGMTEVYDCSTPVERDAYLPNNGEPHRFFLEVAIPEKGLSLRQHKFTEGQPFVPNQIVITSDHFTFGPLRIGVGSPKWLVKLAYLIDIRIAEYRVAHNLIVHRRLMPEERAKEFELAYRFGFTHKSLTSAQVCFRFDENDCMDMMVINFDVKNYVI